MIGQLYRVTRVQGKITSVDYLSDYSWVRIPNDVIPANMIFCGGEKETLPSSKETLYYIHLVERSHHKSRHN